jgi:hypothetical protein
MKPTPKYDFPVGVRRSSLDHVGDAASHYDDIFSIVLNHTVPIEFVPELDRSPPWPPPLPENVDRVASPTEARRATVALADLVVTPDPARPGDDEVISHAHGQCVLFYTSPDEFRALVRELDALERSLSDFHDGVPVSHLAGRRLADLLLHRILRSKAVSADALRMLGR